MIIHRLIQDLVTEGEEAGSIEIMIEVKKRATIVVHSILILIKMARKMMMGTIHIVMTKMRCQLYKNLIKPLRICRKGVLKSSIRKIRVRYMKITLIKC